MEENGYNVRNIKISIDDNKKEVKTQKDKKDRVVTRDKKWTICESDYNSELQLATMKEADISNNVYNLMCCEIKRKISGYKSQDQKKINIQKTILSI